MTLCKCVCIWATIFTIVATETADYYQRYDSIQFLLFNKEIKDKLVPLPPGINLNCELVIGVKVTPLELPQQYYDYDYEESSSENIIYSEIEPGDIRITLKHPSFETGEEIIIASVDATGHAWEKKIACFSHCANITEYKTFSLQAKTNITGTVDVEIVLKRGNHKCEKVENTEYRINKTTIIEITTDTMNSSSFCTDPEDYECKHLGITKCVPKLNRSTTQKPLPIEKPPCAVPCLDTDSWCEERGACIAKDEHCDCGPDKIYCTSEDAYSCESRKGILQSHIFNICRNGECRKNCTMAEEEEMEGCGEGQFRCGGMCLDNVEVAQFKTCNKHCISVHKTCYAKQEEVSVAINDSEKGFSSHWIYVICLCVSGVFFILVLFGVSGFLYYRV